MKNLVWVGAFCLVFGCGDDDGTADTGVDTGAVDTGTGDTGATVDTGTTDTGGAMDTGDDTAADSATDGATACSTDSECTEGEEWCVGGECVECDNSGLLCDIACTEGWNTYMRNGCSPCACAPTNACTQDSECEGAKCYAGEFCWDWCPAGDPSCCLGNVCSAAGCDGDPPVGCFTRGCAEGAECQDFATSGSCVASGCSCSDGSWVCTDDCGGGACALSL